jgi:hypothetical protein
VQNTKRLEWWEREHSVAGESITLEVASSPIDSDWIIRADGWRLPSNFTILYRSLEAAQRAADDVLLNNVPHDCRQCACGEWKMLPARPSAWVIDPGSVK